MEIRDIGPRGPSPASLQRSPDHGAVRPRRHQGSSGDLVEISARAQKAALAAALARRVVEMPEVRPEVLEAARVALESGEFLTPEAAQATARAIIRGS